MKLHTFIVSLAFCVLFSGCHKPDIEPSALPVSPLHDTLTNIDSLLQIQSDMAMERLTIFTDSIDNEVFTDADRNYVLLMKSEALWKGNRTEEIDFET